MDILDLMNSATFSAAQKISGIRNDTDILIKLINDKERFGQKLLMPERQIDRTLWACVDH